VGEWDAAAESCVLLDGVRDLSLEWLAGGYSECRGKDRVQELEWSRRKLETVPNGLRDSM
jgi:hypothetical protein